MTCVEGFLAHKKQIVQGFFDHKKQRPSRVRGAVSELNGEIRITCARRSRLGNFVNVNTGCTAVTRTGCEPCCAKRVLC